ncbi:hypothetical protein QWZ06_19550 [Chryseobacterium tructae]|uniref:Uncharacterized protein n=1 Tax=Chryseobacterium tructae TaxID=1037380 RepID=A0ABV7Y344_9FLAO|nr:hypothetical protein [Chryseobacterium tructae]MDN3694319.1 hypothetical protein [Chryseobacterium tructae]
MDKAEKLEKWKYKGSNLSSFRKDDKEFEDLSQVIDTANKEELKGVFDNGLESKYDQYKKYLFNHNLFLFRDLEQHIKDSVNCLIIDAYIPSITNTNLLLERALKLALIQFEVGAVIDYDDKEIIEAYIKADKQYAGKNMEANIQRCIKYKILNAAEAKELKDYKLKFRDGFSHFTPINILKEERLMTNISLEEHPGLEKTFKLPQYQSMQVVFFAIKNAENHLRYVLDIINHLQFKVLEEFRKNFKAKEKS